MECEELMQIIDAVIRLYTIMSMHNELEDVRQQLLQVIKALFEKAKGVCEEPWQRKNV